MINKKIKISFIFIVLIVAIALPNLSFAHTLPCSTACTDKTDCDLDGHDAPGCGGDDCNDDNPDVYPGAPEFCFGGIDENCNKLIDCHDPKCCGDTDCPEGPDKWWFDNDKDHYTTCEYDCNDNNPDVYPGAYEYCFGGIDENCNTLIDCEDPVCAGQTRYNDKKICCLHISDCPQKDYETETCENNICTYTQNDPYEIPEYPPGYIIPILLTLLATYRLKGQHISL